MKNKLIFITGIFLVFSIANASACYLNFIITDSHNNEKTVKPFENITVNSEENYVLTVIFTQDHRNCIISAEETDFLLYEEKWKTTKDYLPMQLVSISNWEKTGAHCYTIELEFIPKAEGTWELRILRECLKGGYDECLVFNIL